MRRTGLALVAAVLMAAAFGGMVGAQGSRAEVALRAARETATVRGDLKAAIEQYRKVAEDHRDERPVAAAALLGLAECYQKLGDSQAQAVYERILREFSDQPGAVTEARARLDARTAPRSTTAARRLVCDDCGGEISVSSDGRQAVIVDWSSGDLARREFQTGRVTRLMAKIGSWTESSDYADVPVLSPDGRQVVYAWFNEADATYQLRVIPTGGKPRVLVRNPELVYFEPAAWSDDASRVLTVVYRQDNTAQLAWISLKDGAVSVLKSLEWRLAGGIGRPALSPDGRFIAYSARAVNPSGPRPAPSEPSDQHLYVLTADASSEHVLTSSPSINESPVWSPDGTRVLFISNRTGSFDVWSIAVRGGKPASLPTSVKTAVGRGTLVSLDASGALLHLRRAEIARFGVTIIDLDTVPRDGKTNAASRSTSRFPGSNVSWSPDGKYIAFSRPIGDTEAFDVVVHSTASGDERVFRKERLRAHPPLWLRDGRAVLVSAFPEGVTVGQARIWYRVHLENGTFTEVLGPEETRARSGAAALAPDDRTMYFAFGPLVSQSEGSTAVWDSIGAVDLLTKEQRTVYTFGGGASEAPPQGRLGFDLSPDGATLALLVAGAGSTGGRLASVGADGSHYRELYGSFASGGALGQVRWSHDGRHVYFVRRDEQTKRDEIMRISADGGEAVFTGIAAPTINTINVSPDGRQVAYMTRLAPSYQLWALDNVLEGAAR